MINYACIKNNIVENIILLEEINPELVQQIKETFSYDEVVLYDSALSVQVGYLYDGTDLYVTEGKKALRLDEGDPDKPLLPEESEQ
jgi:hypothetical protein